MTEQEVELELERNAALTRIADALNKISKCIIYNSVTGEYQMKINNQ